MRKNKILVTGGTGFLGSSLLPILICAGYDVAIVVRNMSLAIDVNPDVAKYEITTDYLSVYDALNSFKPDLVIHAATFFTFEHSQENLHELSYSNLIFPLNLLEAMNSAECKYLLNIGSTWQFNSAYERVPVNLYAAMKNAFECLMDYYTATQKIKATTLYLSDTYGPNDRRKKLMNLLVSKVVCNNEEMIAMSPGHQKLDLLHISDVTNAIAMLTDSILENRTPLKKCYQLYPSKKYSLREIVSVFEDLTGKNMNINWGAKQYRPNEVMEVPRLFKPPEGWVDLISLKKGLSELIADAK